MLGWDWRLELMEVGLRDDWYSKENTISKIGVKVSDSDLQFRETLLGSLHILM